MRYDRIPPPPPMDEPDPPIDMRAYAYRPGSLYTMDPDVEVVAFNPDRGRAIAAGLRTYADFLLAEAQRGVDRDLDRKVTLEDVYSCPGCAAERVRGEPCSYCGRGRA